MTAQVPTARPLPVEPVERAYRLPQGMRRAAAMGLQSPPTLLHRQIAARIAADEALTEDEIEVIAEYAGEDAALLCLGGPMGRLWATEQQAAARTAHPLGWLFGTEARETAFEEGTRYWLHRERALRVPAELRLARVMASLYRLWTGQIVAALPQVVKEGRSIHRRQLTPAEMDLLFDAPEAVAKLKETMGPKLAEVIRIAFEAAAKDMALTGNLAWSPVYAVPEKSIGTQIVNVPETVRSAVDRVINQGLAEGWTTAQMQAQIKALPEMSVGRALTVARTESARVVTEGQNAAMQEAVAIGARVKREWVSARDAATRKSHLELDANEVSVGEPWTFKVGEHAGSTTQGPGLSGIAAEDINCRCAVRPRIVKEPPP